MKYMLLVYGDENHLTEAEREDCFGESAQLAHDLQARGQYVAASPLHKTPTAKSVRSREGRALVTDGPFAETREQLGGYYIVDVATEAEAVEIAGRIPGARWGTVEVRPIVELDNLPDA